MAQTSETDTDTSPTSESTSAPAPEFAADRPADGAGVQEFLERNRLDRDLAAQALDGRARPEPGSDHRAATQEFLDRNGLDQGLATGLLDGASPVDIGRHRPANADAAAAVPAPSTTSGRQAPDRQPAQDRQQHWHHRFFSPYALAVALSLLALCPFIVLTTATDALSSLIGSGLHTSPTVLQVGSGLANAGYALGAVIAADMAQRFVQRHLFLAYEALFVVASVGAALAPNATVYVIAHVLQGAATGLLLVAALPPLILRFPPSRLPLTVAFVNIGLFGATALGPFVGDIFAHLGTWRWVFAGAAVLGALGWTAGWFGYEKWAPMNPDLPKDLPVFPMAVAATALPFLGSALAGKVGFASPWFWAPIGVGVAALITMITYQYHHRREPLMPVRALSSTLPVAGTVGAMLGGGAFVATLSLISMALEQRGVGLVEAGLDLLPMVIGVGVSSLLFRHLITRPGLPLLAAGGLVSVAAGTALAIPITMSGPTWLIPIAAVLLGFGAGSAVAPALFLAGMGVEAMKIGRAFALIELLRSEAAFLIAPVLAVYVTHVGGLGGVRQGLVVSLVIAGAGLVLSVAVYLLSGTRRHAPTIEAWLNNEGTALHSPRVFAKIRRISLD